MGITQKTIYERKTYYELKKNNRGFIVAVHDRHANKLR